MQVLQVPRRPPEYEQATDRRLHQRTVQIQEKQFVSDEANQKPDVSAPQLLPQDNPRSLRGSQDEDEMPGARHLRWLNIGEVAGRTDTSVSTIRREIRLRKLAFYRIGRNIRVGEDDLEDYLAKRRHRTR